MRFERHVSGIGSTKDVSYMQNSSAPVQTRMTKPEVKNWITVLDTGHGQQQTQPSEKRKRLKTTLI